MKRDRKTTQIDATGAIFEENSTFYLFDFNKLTVAQSVDLRKTLRKQGSGFKVIKNRLALRALKAEFPETLKGAFRRPTAIAFTGADPVVLAKALREFSTQNKVLVMKGGMVQGQFVPAERFDEITRLASRPELLAKVGYLMASPLTRLLRALQSPLGTVGGLLHQMAQKKQ